MIDCGEGAQMRLSDFHIPRNKINHLFISHLHGDHIFGIVGLLTSYSLAGRKERFHLFSPAGLQEMIEVTLRVSSSVLSFSVEFIPLIRMHISFCLKMSKSLYMPFH